MEWQRPAQSKRLLAFEVATAAAFGLLPGVLHALVNAASGASHVPDIMTRILYVLALITGPGVLVGSTLIALVVGFLTTNDPWLDRLAVNVGLIVNVAAFGALWFMMRTGCRESFRWKMAVALLVVWLVFSIPFAIFGSMWMVL